jgi:hypothetical protein
MFPAQEDHVSSNENGMSAVPQPYARPTSSLARRVTVEEWQDLELKQEYQSQYARPACHRSDIDGLLI